MLPWEHAAVAYLLYSGYSRVRYGEPPKGWPVLIVLFASQLPDLIDKPLAWHFGVLPSGRSLAHSIFVGVPLSALVLGLAHRRGRPELGSAFTIGYLSHLATDAVPLYPSASTSFESILWPLFDQEYSHHHHEGFLELTIDILIGNYPSLFTADPDSNVLIAIAIVGVMLLVWIVDGAPGVQETVRLVRWPIDLVRDRY